MKMAFRRNLITVLATTLLGGCGSSPPPPANGAAAAMNREFDGAPKWVFNCSTTFGSKKNGICGVGSVANMSNPALARTAAEGRGRAAIARSMQVRVKTMLKDYQDSTRGGADGKAGADEQKITDVSIQVSNRMLEGTQTQDLWTSGNGTLYALVVLNLDAFLAQLKEMKELDEQMRVAIGDRAEKAFQETDARTESPNAPPDASQQ